MIYNRIQGKNMSINASVYYNTIDVLGWNAPKAQVARLGKQDLLGADIEVLYKGSKFTIGANHSFTKQLSWKLDDSVNAAGVSYSDYRNKIAYKDNYGNNRTVVVSGTGNSINNLPTNITKVFVNYSPFKMWTFHVDGRIFWDYQGGRDGLTALSNAAFSLNDSSSTMRGRIFDAVAEARNRKVYDMDIRTNVSISFHPTANVEFVAFCQNLTDYSRNKRYNIDAGNANYYPSRATFVVEPRSFGLKMKYTF